MKKHTLARKRFRNLKNPPSENIRGVLGGGGSCDRRRQSKKAKVSEYKNSGRHEKQQRGER